VAPASRPTCTPCTHSAATAAGQGPNLWSHPSPTARRLDSCLRLASGSVITALTAQNSVGVTAVEVPPVSFLRATVEALKADLPPRAIKIGMLGSAEVSGRPSEPDSH
jgi:hypothetical protein